MGGYVCERDLVNKNITFYDDEYFIYVYCCSKRVVSGLLRLVYFRNIYKFLYEMDYKSFLNENILGFPCKIGALIYYMDG